MRAAVGLRWTIGDVSERGFEALALSIWGAWRIFGSRARYAVCVNTVGVDDARARVGEVPDEVEFRDVSGAMPDLLLRHLDERFAEGVGWKFAPPQVFPDRYEIALDNDCILWALPREVELWLSEGEPGRCLIAEDVRPCFGRFAPFCGPEPRNSGIRGLPPGFDLMGALSALLARVPERLTSELDEQGLQVAAVSRRVPPRVVPVEDVTICSPFPPHRPHLGRAGAHFVGLNARSLPWSLEGRPAEAWIREHFDAHRRELYARVGRRPPRL